MFYSIISDSLRAFKMSAEYSCVFNKYSKKQNIVSDLSFKFVCMVFIWCTEIWAHLEKLVTGSFEHFRNVHTLIIYFSEYSWKWRCLKTAKLKQLQKCTIKKIVKQNICTGIICSILFFLCLTSYLCHCTHRASLYDTRWQTYHKYKWPEMCRRK